MRWLVAMTLIASVGCGVSTGGSGAETTYVVLAKRLGKSLHLDVVGYQNARRQGGPFEDPDNWSVTVSAGGQALRRVVKGSVRVMRKPVGMESEWRVAVEFSVAFAMPTASKHVEVSISAPGATPQTLRVQVRAPPNDVSASR